MRPEIVIEMHHVFKIYPNQISALSDITFEVFSGEFLFIAGPSGCGKSALLRIIFCAERPTKGEVVVCGLHITQPGFKKIHHLRRMMGIISPDFKLLRDRSVIENITFALEVTGYASKESRKKALEMLDRVGLRKREGDSIINLSAGEQQRVAIARALVNAPTLILADEPTGNLDAQTTFEVMEIFRDQHLGGSTVVLATQDMDLLRRYPHRVIYLKDGRKTDSLAF